MLAYLTACMHLGEENKVFATPCRKDAIPSGGNSPQLPAVGWT